ncbi:MAG: hypothetical protein ACFE0Q_00130 [Anaerolineae bacterium]
MRTLMSNFQFMLLWSLGSIVSLFGTTIITVIIVLIASLLTLFNLNQLILSGTTALLILGVIATCIGLFSGLIYGNVQKTILRRHTREPWRGWLITSIVGHVVGFNLATALIFVQGIGYVTWAVLPSSETLMWFGFQVLVVIFGCVGISQMIALQQYVIGAWAWILANIVAGVVLFSLLAFGIFSWALTAPLVILSLFLVGASPGIVTGFAMVWLVASNWRDQ